MADISLLLPDAVILEELQNCLKCDIIDISIQSVLVLYCTLEYRPTRKHIGYLYFIRHRKNKIVALEEAEKAFYQTYSALINLQSI